MKMNTAVRLMKLLPTKTSDAITVVELTRKWFGYTDTQAIRKTELRKIQRYVNDMAQEDGESPPLLCILDSVPRRVYLKLSEVSHWFMSEEAALNIVLTRQILGRSLATFEKIGPEALIRIAKEVTNASPPLQRICDTLRVIPDGIGRLHARIDPAVLKETINAITSEKKLTFRYYSTKNTESAAIVSPVGLVAKDGTLYLLGIQGLSDRPKTYAMQRMSHAEVSHLQRQLRPDFNLDDYIHASHMLSHVLHEQTGLIELELQVHPDTLYHFKERPLADNQTIHPAGTDGRHRLEVTLPSTMLLVPFLLSMGAGIEVTKPASVRTELRERLINTLKHY